MSHSRSAAAADGRSAPRVQMIDSRLWEEEGTIRHLGPGEDPTEWLHGPEAGDYSVEHIMEADVGVGDDRGEQLEVVALIPADEHLPVLYYLVPRETWLLLEPTTRDQS